MNKFNLEDPDKIKLIELLLVVDTILVAFKFLPDNFVWIFILFVVMAIVLFIKLKKGTEKNRYYNLNVAVASLFFSGTLSYELGYSLGVAIHSATSIIPEIYEIRAAQILAMAYYITISYILYLALRNEKV